MNENILASVMETHDSVRKVKEKLEKVYPELVNLANSGFFDKAMSGFNDVLSFSLLYRWEKRLEYFRVFFAENAYVYNLFGRLLSSIQDLKSLLKEVSEYGEAKPEEYVKRQLVLISPSTFSKLDADFDLIESMIDALNN